MAWWLRSCLGRSHPTWECLGEVLDLLLLQLFADAAVDGRHICILVTHVGDIDSILGPGLKCGPASASVGIWGVDQLVEDPISVSVSLSLFLFLCLFFSFISLPFKQNVEINKKLKKKEPGQDRKQGEGGYRTSGGRAEAALGSRFSVSCLRRHSRKKMPWDTAEGIF